MISKLYNSQSVIPGGEQKRRRRRTRGDPADFFLPALDGPARRTFFGLMMGRLFPCRFHEFHSHKRNDKHDMFIKQFRSTIDRATPTRKLLLLLLPIESERGNLKRNSIWNNFYIPPLSVVVNLLLLNDATDQGTRILNSLNQNSPTIVTNTDLYYCRWRNYKVISPCHLDRIRGREKERWHDNCSCLLPMKWTHNSVLPHQQTATVRNGDSWTFNNQQKLEESGSNMERERNSRGT